ncbi:PQQ-binding-like beta-propeller repeat protein, partial [Streptomyces mesophilus]|uniref:outer membrane protein assembly factor BamB family protein n=1 Tax=Streptomyces mesophilus TaxID=1775132 RepID=UPI00332BB9B4
RESQAAVTVAAAPASRRTLLAAGGGLVLGAGAVAGWVLGRGGTEALTSPGARPAAARTTIRVPRGSAPATLWRYDGKSGEPLVWPLSLFGGEIGYVPEPPRLTAIGLDTGELLWTRDDLPDPQRILPLAGQAVTARAGRLLGLSTRDGKELWTRPVTVNSGRGRLKILNGSLEERTVYYHTGPEEGASMEAQPPYVVAVRVPDGGERWRLKVRTGALDELVMIAVPGLGDDVHLMERRMPGGARITRIDSRAGRERWTRVHDWPHDWAKGGMGLLDYDPYSEQLVELSHGTLRAARVDDTAPRWSLDLYDEPDDDIPRKPNTTQARRIKGVDGPLYFIAGPHQSVHAVDLKTGREHWRHRLPVDLVRDRTTGSVIPPWLRITESGRTLLAAHRLGVVALDPRTGTEFWRFAVANASDGYQVHSAGELALIVNGLSVYALPVK